MVCANVLLVNYGKRVDLRFPSESEIIGKVNYNLKERQKQQYSFDN